MERDPIFARTRVEYDSYSDFWRLVELSAFPTCYVDEIQLDAPVTYITTPINGSFRPHIRNEIVRVGENRRAKLVWWGLERPDAGGARPWSSEVSDMLLYADEVWVSDAYFGALDPRARFVPLGSHSGLGGPRSTAVRYDVTFQGYMVPRRQSVENACIGLGLSIGPSGWGVERDAVLRATRVMLNMHQHDSPLPIAEPLRIALAAAYRMTFVSEHLADPYPLVAGLDYIDVPELAHLAAAVSRAPVLGERLYERLCVEHTFRRGVMEALA